MTTSAHRGGSPGRHWRGWALILLLAGIGFCLRQLAVGGEERGAGEIMGLRAAVVGLSLGAWFLTQAMIGARAAPDGRIGDAVHRLTAPLHGWLLRHPGAVNRILIGSSAGIDLFGLFLIGIALFGPSLRPFIALLLLFVFRQICQWACALPPPEGMIWRHPGFPSLLVTYHVANDFFISGHTAIAVLGAIEVARVGPWWLGALAGGVAVLEALTVLVLRAHYTMDVLGAIVAALAASGLAGHLCGAL